MPEKFLREGDRVRVRVVMHREEPPTEALAYVVITIADRRSRHLAELPREISEHGAYGSFYPYAERILSK
jgi:hypothetical protein